MTSIRNQAINNINGVPSHLTRSIFDLLSQYKQSEVAIEELIPNADLTRIFATPQNNGYYWLEKLTKIALFRERHHSLFSELSVGWRRFIEKNCARSRKAHDYSKTEIAIVLEISSLYKDPGNLHPLLKCHLVNAFQFISKSSLRGIRLSMIFPGSIARATAPLLSRFCICISLGTGRSFPSTTEI
ncbi:MAG: hypothetical protein J2P21_10295 [Chloracidobacterium sp.]|nr:hypothetical protein [Chloracidobacterium sp.]